MFPRSVSIVNRAFSLRAARAALNARAFTTGKQGFASMDPQKQREIASKGGQASHSSAAHPEFARAQAPPSTRYTSNPNRGANVQKRVAQPEKSEYKAGDLVRYKVGLNTTEGLIKSVHTRPVVDELGRTHNGTPEDPIAEIQNHYTKNLVFHHLSALHWLARAQEVPDAYREDVARTTPSATERAATHSTIREVPESKMTEQAHKGDTSAKIDIETSPLHVDFAPGDVVRYHVGRNITAGIVQEIYFTPQHDEFSNFHNASKENPMARIENLWTKHITYHHLNILELVKTAEEVSAGRYAEAKYEPFSHNQERPAGYYESTEIDVEFTPTPRAGATSTTSARR